MKVRAALVAVCALATVAVSTTPASAVTPVVVVASRANEYRPAASTTFLAWTKVLRDYSGRVMAEAIGGSPFRVSAKGADATTGGIDGSTLIYNQDGDIALFDLSTKTALPVPDGVNRKAYEFPLGISGTHLLFVRSQARRYSVLLFDISTGTSIVLYSHENTSRRFAYLQAGQLNGNYAVWDQYVISTPDFAPIRCDVTVYDIAAATSTKVPNPGKRCQSGPAVGADGTLYFDRAGLDCGQHARIIEQPLGGMGSVLYSLPKGHDYAGAVAVDNSDGTTDVYFDPTDCFVQNNQDIWMLPGV